MRIISRRYGIGRSTNAFSIWPSGRMLVLNSITAVGIERCQRYFVSGSGFCLSQNSEHTACGIQSAVARCGTLKHGPCRAKHRQNNTTRPEAGPEGNRLTLRSVEPFSSMNPRQTWQCTRRPRRYEVVVCGLTAPNALSSVNNPGPGTQLPSRVRDTEADSDIRIASVSLCPAESL